MDILLITVEMEFLAGRGIGQLRLVVDTFSILYSRVVLRLFVHLRTPSLYSREVLRLFVPCEYAAIGVLSGRRGEGRGGRVTSGSILRFYSSDTTKK